MTAQPDPRGVPAEPSKLAWKAIHELARKRGVNDEVLARSVAVNSN